MAKNDDLGNEWKDTAYTLGGAFVDLGKTLVHSIKTGVDFAYDFLNEEDKKKEDAAKKKKASAARQEAKKESKEPEVVQGIIIEDAEE